MEPTEERRKATGWRTRRERATASLERSQQRRSWGGATVGGRAWSGANAQSNGAYFHGLWEAGRLRGHATAVERLRVEQHALHGTACGEVGG
ncbi:hypothetical protein ERJ75_001847300 [Trypanosoma vivax]|nr:hypothetical protein ERJ75_001847300 [Trypanosoma vivax]